MVAEKKGLLSKWLKGMGKVREGVQEQFSRLWSGGTIGENDWETLEETLIQADIGPMLAIELVEGFRELKKNSSGNQDWRDWLSRTLLQELAGNESRLFPEFEGMDLKALLLIGINGVGKTTVAGKLANYCREKGEKISLIAADTFRAAAIEQLQIWADRAKVHCIKGSTGADPGSVVFDGMEASLMRNDTLAIIDTAGRSHVNKNLLAELEKVGRIVGKHLPSERVENLIVIDALAGQNAFLQVESIGKSLPIDGVILTKWDSQAKGGIIFRIHKELGLPIKFVGVGEKIEDIIPFDPESFVQALVFDQAVSDQAFS